MRRPLCIVAILMTAVMVLLLIINPEVPSFKERPEAPPGGAPDVRELEGNEEVLSAEGMPGGQTGKSEEVRLAGTVTDRLSKEGYGGLRWEITLDSEILCSLQAGESPPLIGQKVTLTGKIRPGEEAANPGQFDFERWYASRGIFTRLSGCRIEAISGEGNQLRENLVKLRQWSCDILKECLGEEDGSLMAAMLLGDKTGLSDETQALYQQNGISHILSISGLHLMLLGMGLVNLLKKTFLPLPITALISMAMMALYCVFVGGSVSTLRATIMFCVLLLAGVLGRSYDSLSALGLATIIQLILNPYVLWNSGFQLSYLAVVGVSAVVPRLKILFETENKLVHSILVSVGVALVTLPVLLYHFGTYAWHSIFLNLLVVPVMAVLLWLTLILLLLAALISSAAALFIPGEAVTPLFFPGEAVTPLFFSGEAVTSLFFPGEVTAPLFFPVEIVATLIKGILYYYELCCKAAEALPVWETYIGRPYGICIVIYAVGITALLWAPHKQCRLMCLLGFLACIQLLTFKVNTGMEITMLDVGQGDGMVVRSESGRVYIFDCGSSSVSQVGTYRLIPFLRTKGYGRIEGIFISHLDQDHYNGILELLEAASTEHIIIDTLYLPVSVLGEEKTQVQQFLQEESKSPEPENVWEAKQVALQKREEWTAMADTEAFWKPEEWATMAGAEAFWKAEEWAAMADTEAFWKPEEWTAMAGAEDSRKREEWEKLEELVYLAKEADVSIIYLEKGDRLTDGKMKLTCLHPSEGEQYESNNGSLVMTLEYEEFSMLFTGDVEKAGEEEIMEWVEGLEQRDGLRESTQSERQGNLTGSDCLGQVDVLKVAHHGSSGSSSEAFLQTVKPRLSLISCDGNNSYGHPHEETLERLSDTGSIIMATPDYGAITIDVGREVRVRSWKESD